MAKKPVLGGPREVEPNVALVEEIHRTAGLIAELGRIVDGLPERDLVEGVTKTVEFQDGSTIVTTETAPSIWLRLYQQERKHLLDACKVAEGCGVAMKPARKKDAIDDLAQRRADRRSGVASGG